MAYLIHGIRRSKYWAFKMPWEVADLCYLSGYVIIVEIKGEFKLIEIKKLKKNKNFLKNLDN